MNIFEKALHESLNELANEAGFTGIKIGSQERKKAESPFMLAELGRAYLQKHTFTPGDLVQLKPHMKTYGSIHYGEAAVVLEVEPGRRGKNEEDAYLDEPEEIRIGIMLDNALVGVWVDANRFEHYQG